jgi:hypothetical protein
MRAARTSQRRCQPFQPRLSPPTPLRLSGRLPAPSATLKVRSAHVDQHLRGGLTQCSKIDWHTVHWRCAVVTNYNCNHTGPASRIALSIRQMASIPPERLILSLPDDELEKFARTWVELRKGYVGVQRFTGAGDMGRDVVGYLTRSRHEGPWHNYQCKQYGRPVQLNVALEALRERYARWSQSRMNSRQC